MSCCLPNNPHAMKRAPLVILRLLLGGLLLAAGISKLTTPLTTLASIDSYQIPLHPWLAEVLAFSLPWLEILLGLGLLAALWPPVTTTCCAALLGGFTILTAQAWWRGLPIDCGCFDLRSLHPALAALTTPAGATLRNFVLLGLCAALLRMLRTTRRAAINEKSQKTGCPPTAQPPVQ